MSDSTDFEFNDDEIIENIKRKRMQELLVQTHNSYEEIFTEKRLLQITTNSSKVVCHFFKAEFQRCLIMDKHLEKISSQFPNVQFVKINVDNAPFLVSKLKIQVLPCVVLFENAVTIDRIIGFEELGNIDEFKETALTRRLNLHGFLNSNSKINFKL